MSKCTICNKPIELSPSAKERATKDVTGKSAADCTSLFTTHADRIEVIAPVDALPEPMRTHILTGAPLKEFGTYLPRGATAPENTAEELETLKEVVRNYLAEPSLDGRPRRKQLREQLAALTTKQ